MGFRVTAPYVTVKVNTATGPALLGFYTGAVLPSAVDEESARAQVRKGFVEEIDNAPAESEAEQVPAGPVPPRKNASKSDWVAYAVSQRDADTSEEDARAAAEAMSHADLVAAFGG